MADNQKELERLQEKIKTAHDRSKLIENYLDVQKLEREHVDTLINCVYVGKRNAITKVIPIKIEWNF